LTAIAEAALATLYPRVEADFAARAGMPEGGMAIVALGKLGGREMTFGSDLDLLSIYDGPGASVAHTRLSQRFIAAVSAPTAEGKLYEVDMRLRPSGNKGPIATSLESFVHYHRSEAWTWEHMALTRGRAVAGDATVGARIEAEIRAVLTRPRDPDKLLADVADMRRRMERELTKPGDIWDVKHLRGGLVDIEFIAQYLQLRHAHDRPEVLDTNTGAALVKLARDGMLDAAIAAELEAALRLWRNLQGMLRLTTGGAFDEASASDGLKAAVARAAGAAEFGHVAGRIRETAARVRGVFETLIEAPAAALQRGN
jgi:glutamate-ammonia-ligase adenylyltransferase